LTAWLADFVTTSTDYLSNYPRDAINTSIDLTIHLKKTVFERHFF
jgi:hypothetical protein